MVAVSNAVMFVGATPIYADSTPNNYNPGWSEIQKSVSPKTKAIIVSHTYGVPVEDIEHIALECDRRGWILIEDISECVGVQILTTRGDKQLLGTFGDYACASLYANKIVHSGDGGFVLAKNPMISSRLKSLVNHGFTPSFHFVHFEAAINGKMNGVGAAMACGCLDNLDFVMDHRQMICKAYRNQLTQTPLTLMPPCGVNDTPWVFGVQCRSKSERTQLRAFLAQHGVETRDYFFPLHLQPFNSMASGIRLPNSEQFGSTGFYLPTYTDLGPEDIRFITSVICAFYSQSESLANPRVMSPPKICKKERLLIKPDSFEVIVRNENGEMKSRGHPLTSALRIELQLSKYLTHEPWDLGQSLLHEMNLCLSHVENQVTKTKLEYHWGPFIDYINCQNIENGILRPWILEDLQAPQYVVAREIKTTTDAETLQLLTWIVKTNKPRVIWELGCWIGHATVRMAIAAKLALKSEIPRIFACDGFRWQKWMDSYLTPIRPLKPGDSFRSRFETNTDTVSDCVTAVEWRYDISELPTELRDNPDPDLVFVDISQEDSDLEHAWTLMSPKFKAGKTILVFNGLNRSSLPFFTRHAQNLKPIAKPHTIAKAFLYIQPKLENTNLVPTSLLLRKFNFQMSPDWSHHHQNAFNMATKNLSAEFHDPDAQTLFIPAVEETLCDTPELLLTKPWIGIIHSVRKNPEQFYVPDLERLCSPTYAAAMRSCKGLFTLTNFQADYLRKHLRVGPDAISIPVQPLVYPIIHNPSSLNSWTNVTNSWTEGTKIDLVLIGSFARDFNAFYNCKVPNNLRKVLLTGDDVGAVWSKSAPNNVTVLPRVNSEEYERILGTSIVILFLKYEGAANTIILECIDRNTPIVIPSISSCTEYIGENYPLQYKHDEQNGINLCDIITLENVSKAVKYLKEMDKSKFQPERFVETVRNSNIVLATSPFPNTEVNSYDVTVSITSYKRTHHLPQLLDSFWNHQDFKGRVQIIVWNNNDARTGIVNQMCKKYVEVSNSTKSLEVINSTENYYCTIRLALVGLMKSDKLLICDDDILPSPNFISFFLAHHLKYPKDVLCLRGHSFIPHSLDIQNARNAWENYDSVRFKSDEAPEQFVHFVHADACLIPRSALREVSSVEMPDAGFNLVDDYWLSFVLSHKFGRNLRKLISTSGTDMVPVERTEDSDTVGLALHTLPEVRDARVRLYLHHMLQGWPKWAQIPTLDEQQIWRTSKMEFWTKPFIGFNVWSGISESEVMMLKAIGITCVRIGAVGAGGIAPGYDCEFSELVNDHERALKKLCRTINVFEKYGISVVITLTKNLANPPTWKMIATELCWKQNVVAYDVINEPFMSAEKEMHWSEIASLPSREEFTEDYKTYADIIEAIRTVDIATPIMIESSFWAHIDAIHFIPLQLLKQDSNLMISFHFYEPQIFKNRSNSDGKYKFPGEIPIYQNPLSETILWNEEYIKGKFSVAKKWAQDTGVKIVLGEFGVCRDIQTGVEYLQSIMNVCVEIGLPAFLFSFRDPHWDAMNYEFGTNPNNFKNLRDQNVYWEVIKNSIKEMSIKI